MTNNTTADKTNWERFFDAHAPIYMENVFVKNTVQEVDFLLEELSLPPQSTILDVGCGTGRHSIELAKRGYRVTGLDLSAEMLNQARKYADEAGVEVNWVQGNAAGFSFDEPFDAVIGLCEGAFGLLSLTDDPIEQPLAILRNIAGSLKPQAKTILTVLNAAHMIRKYTNDDVAGGRFDPIMIVESYPFSPREGVPEMPVREKAFAPTEMALLCRMAGLSVINMWGGTAGNWGRRPLDLDEMEIMVVAQKGR
jgi:SAM-dependent methyltransferase